MHRGSGGGSDLVIVHEVLTDTRHQRHADAWAIARRLRCSTETLISPQAEPPPAPPCHIEVKNAISSLCCMFMRRGTVGASSGSKPPA